MRKTFIRGNFIVVRIVHAVAWCGPVISSYRSLIKYLQILRNYTKQHSCFLGDCSRIIVHCHWSFYKIWKAIFLVHRMPAEIKWCVVQSKKSFYHSLAEFSSTELQSWPWRRVPPSRLHSLPLAGQDITITGQGELQLQTLLSITLAVATRGSEISRIRGRPRFKRLVADTIRQGRAKWPGELWVIAALQHWSPVTHTTLSPCH